MLFTKKGVMDFELYRRTVEVNLHGTVYSAAHCAFYMSKNEPDKDGQRGIIINVSSNSASEAQFSQVGYGSSKGGVDAITLPMARDLGKFGI